MKGQMFIIAAMFMIIGMVAAKNLLSTTLEEEKRFVESADSDKIIRNIANEYRYLVSVSAAQAQPNKSAITYFSDFTSYLRKDVEGFSGLYAFVDLNASTSKYSVNAGNYLGGSVNMTVNATGSTPAGYNFTLNDKQNRIVEFSFTNENFNVTLNYTINGISALERFPMLAKNYSAIFIDIRLSRSNIDLAIKEVYNRTRV